MWSSSRTVSENVWVGVPERPPDGSRWAVGSPSVTYQDHRLRALKKRRDDAALCERMVGCALLPTWLQAGRLAMVRAPPNAIMQPSDRNR